MSAKSFVVPDDSPVFHKELDRRYPLIERGEGLWLTDTNGTKYLDAISGGAMVTVLGHGVQEINQALADQAAEISFIYNQQFTSPAQEQLAEELLKVAPDGFTRANFVNGGAEGNEAALRMVRHFHLDRGEPQRARIISPAQSYHGPTMGTFSLAGRPAMTGPYAPYLTQHLHIPPATWRFDPTGREALEVLDARLEEAGEGNVAAYFCEPVHAASLPGYRYPDLFWEGLAERREQHGFLIVFDEVVTGVGRTGTWFAADQLPIEPDIIVVAKGLGAGYAPVGAVICREHVYQAIAEGSRTFEAGHTWNGCPMPSAVGLAVLKYVEEHQLVDRVAEFGPRLLERLKDELESFEMVREVRGSGLLLGVEYVDPRDGESFLPQDLKTARRIDTTALENELLLYSSQPTGDGFTGDQTLLAPAFVIDEGEIDELVGRLAMTVAAVENDIKHELGAKAGAAAA